MKREPAFTTLSEALSWAETHWSEQPTPPVRLHERGVEPESQLGAPKLAGVFFRYLTVSGDAVETVSTTERCYHPRLPQDRDGNLLGILCACSQECGRLHCPDCLSLGTLTRSRDRFSFPMRAALNRLSREPRWYGTIVMLARSGWSHVKAGIHADDAMTAIRKLHHNYSSVPIGRVVWTEMSESQQRAEDAAA